LHAIAKGRRPFSWRVLRDVVAQVEWKRVDNAAKRERWLDLHPDRRRHRDRPRYQVNLSALTRGEASRITPWVPPVVMPQRDPPPKPRRAPSQWNEE
jgi:hypothetical protein